MRQRIITALKDAMLDRDKVKTGTIRLMMAAIKYRDIEVSDGGILDDGAIMMLLSKMIKQNEESAITYEDAGRMELAQKERAEILVIREFLPAALTLAEMEAAIDKAFSETNASSIRDMGKIMGFLKLQYAGQMDFGIASKLIKAKLS